MALSKRHHRHLQRTGGLPLLRVIAVAAVTPPRSIRTPTSWSGRSSLQMMQDIIWRCLPDRGVRVQILGKNIHFILLHCRNFMVVTIFVEFIFCLACSFCLSYAILQFVYFNSTLLRVHVPH